MSRAVGRRSPRHPCCALSRILPLCACGARAAPAVERAATLGRSIAGRSCRLRPDVVETAGVRGVRRKSDPLAIGTARLAHYLRAASPADRGADIAELLRAFSGIHLGRVEIAFGVGGDVVHPMEVAGIAAVASEPPDDLAGFTHERAHLIVGAVGIEQEALFAVDPEVEVPDRTRG